MKHDEEYYRELLKNNNVLAFLLMIRKGEGTLGATEYRRHFGGGLIDGVNKRPAHKVYTIKNISSSAIGAYQFLNSSKHPYWDEVADKFNWDDFLPEHQDIGALLLMDQNGSIDDVVNGNIVSAINKNKKTWASLPGSPYNQPTQKPGDALLFYQNNGGALNAAGQGIVSGSTDSKAKPVSNGKRKQGTSMMHINESKAISLKNRMDAKDIIMNSLAFGPPGLLVSLPALVKDQFIAIQQRKEIYPPKPNGQLKPGKNIVGYSTSLNKAVNTVDRKIQLAEIPAISNKYDQDSFLNNTFYCSFPVVTEASEYSDAGKNNGIYKPFTIGEDPIFRRAKENHKIIEERRRYEQFLLGNTLREKAENSDADPEFEMESAALGSRMNSRKSIEINLNRPIIETLTIHTKDSGDSISEIKRKVEEALLEILNSANAIH